MAAGDDSTAHAHVLALHERGERVLLEHEALAKQAEKARLLWTNSDDAPTTKRAKRKLRDQAREFSALALSTLVDACISGDSTASRVSAARELLDRGYGKSVEHLEVDDKRDGEAARMVQALAELRANPATSAALLTLAEAAAKQAARD